MFHKLNKTTKYENLIDESVRHYVELDSAHRRESAFGSTARAAYRSAHGALRLFERYYAEIAAWDWLAIKADALGNVGESWDSDGESFGYSYLGSVFSIMPSGKYYTFWANGNVTDYEALLDETFNAALDSIAESHGMWIESGEGDPCDLYAVCAIDSDESD